jgi:hypothetical protein
MNANVAFGFLNETSEPADLMKTFGLAVLAAIGGYLIGLFSGMFLIEAFSNNSHDRSLEAAMTSAFVVGPLTAATAVIMVLIARARRSH